MSLFNNRPTLQRFLSDSTSIAVSEYFDSFFEMSELHKVLLLVVLKGSPSFQYDVIHMYVSIDGLYGFSYLKPVFSSREGY